MLRSSFFKVFFYLGVIIVMIFAVPALLFPNKIILSLGKFLGKWTAFCLKFFLNIKINIIGKENIINDENFFIASAHQSIFETFFLQSVFKYPIFILKKELLKIPIFGWHLKKINAIPIERNVTTKENLGFFEKIVKTINETKRPLIIFPQGTRTPVEEKLPFKKGVARIYEYLNIKCIPVALNSGDIWPKNGIIKSNKTITISILKPINPKMERNLFLKTLEENIYNEIDNIKGLTN